MRATAIMIAALLSATSLAYGADSPGKPMAMEHVGHDHAAMGGMEGMGKPVVWTA